jgi:hypothetical protein
MSWSIMADRPPQKLRRGTSRRVGKPPYGRRGSGGKPRCTGTGMQVKSGSSLGNSRIGFAADNPSAGLAALRTPPARRIPGNLTPGHPGGSHPSAFPRVLAPSAFLQLPFPRRGAPDCGRPQGHLHRTRSGRFPATVPRSSPGAEPATHPGHQARIPAGSPLTAPSHPSGG